MEKCDDLVFSNLTRMVYEEGVDENGDRKWHEERLTWREVAEQRADELKRLHGFAQIVADLDRNEHGRHEGDVDSSDPTGYSQGNPRLKTGDVLGYSISGERYPYVMPDRRDRHDPVAWGGR